MIAIVLLSLLHVTSAAAAVPFMKDSDPMMLALNDQIEGFMLEAPDYEDPDMLDYEISAMGANPMLSLVHLGKKHPNPKNRNVSQKERFALIKSDLDDIITRLQKMQARLEKGNGAISYEDIERSIQGLKDLERYFRPSISQLLNKMRQSMSLSKPLHASGILRITTIQPSMEVLATEEPVESKAPVHEAKPTEIKISVHEVKPTETKAPVHEIQPSATEAPVYYDLKPNPTESSIFALPPPSTVVADDGDREDDEMKPSYAEGVFKSESIKGTLQLLCTNFPSLPPLCFSPISMSPALGKFGLKCKLGFGADVVFHGLRAFDLWVSSWFEATISADKHSWLELCQRAFMVTDVLSCLGCSREELLFLKLWPAILVFKLARRLLNN
ncbi:hypothetical protein CEXT_204561 [Caerostris extrusa]|uniref:Uncharacterized protein n=1 Tax=Caerostris extrusa TaxID=172846 RepID=A0AAV4MW30_CAEEX|nr:hypothetical protein CEXT_204561 [Caerostris extrusa]